MTSSCLLRSDLASLSERLPLPGRGLFTIRTAVFRLSTVGAEGRLLLRVAGYLPVEVRGAADVAAQRAGVRQAPGEETAACGTGRGREGRPMEIQPSKRALMARSQAAPRDEQSIAAPMRARLRAGRRLFEVSIAKREPEMSRPAS